MMLAAARWLLEKRVSQQTEGAFRIQIIMLALTVAAVVGGILALPISDATRAQLLSLLGILLSAAIALSSTTFLGNIMAGMMLRAVRPFKGGDFIRVGEHFGRVSERELFHIEIQTADRARRGHAPHRRRVLQGARRAREPDGAGRSRATRDRS